VRRGEEKKRREARPETYFSLVALVVVMSEEREKFVKSAQWREKRDLILTRGEPGGE